ncbi:MAG: hypothetical protein ABSF84_10460 [Acidimicrobiales bacterium]
MAIPVGADANLSDDEAAQLAAILGCGVNELPGMLETFASAALEEYIRMFLGQRVFTRGSDVLEYRLLLLTKHAFGGNLPDEQRVSALFQKSTTGSRALIRATVAKFQYELISEVAQTIAQVLGDVEPDTHGWKVVINSEPLVETMNRQLGIINGILPTIVRRAGTAASYHLEPSAYQALCEHFEIAPKQP